MFQEIDSDSLAVIASCLLDIGPKLDSKITKMITNANMLILTQGSQSNKLEFMFLQIAPQLGHQSSNIFCFLLRLIQQKSTLLSKWGLILRCPASAMVAPS